MGKNIYMVNFDEFLETGSGLAWELKTPRDPVLERLPHFHEFYLQQSHQVLALKVRAKFPSVFRAGGGKK